MKHQSQHLRNIFTFLAITFVVVFFITAFQATAKAAQSMVAAGHYHTVGLKLDGTVVAVGENDDGRCDVSSWTDIVQVSAYGYHTLGLKSNGTVVGVGSNDNGQLNVSSWTDIVQVSAGYLYTVGLKSDGTVVGVGNNAYGQLNVSSWTDIVQVSAGAVHTVGLKSDGTVVAVGENDDGRCDVSSWTDIVQVAGAAYYTVGLKSDGTVVGVGNNSYGQLNVSSWTDIVQISAGGWHTVGLKSDGTALAVGHNSYGQCDVSSWTDIMQVSAGTFHTVGLKSDGTVVAVGRNDDGQCDVFSWDLLENQPPLADAGKDQVVFDEVTLDGSGSFDTDGTIVSFDWVLQHRENFAYDRTAAGVNPTISDLDKGFYDATLTVTDDVGLSGTDTMLLAAAGPYVCTANTMHIQSINAGVLTERGPLKHGSVTVTILDDCGSPVSGADVTGTFEGDFNETITGTTGTDGTAVISTAEYVKAPSYQFCVDDVTHSSLAYDSSGNVETCKIK
jgi:hypothetical protein